MLDSIYQFQETTESFHKELDNIEIKAKNTYPNTAPLIDLYQRLFKVKKQFCEVAANIELIEKAQNDLQEAIKKYYIPSADAVYNACNSTGRFHVDKFAIPTLKIPPAESQRAEKEKVQKIQEEARAAKPKKKKTYCKENRKER